jgi:hypothetical protein
VWVRGDRVDEMRERFRLELSRPRGLRVRDGVGLGLIRDDDPQPRVRLADVSVTEPATGSAQATVRVSMDRPSSRRVVLMLATSPGEADETDYVSFELTRRVPAGQRGIDVPVEVLADTVDEPAETFHVRVLSLSRATLAKGAAAVTIDPPTPATD